MPITEEMKKLLLQKGITGVSDPNGKVRIYCETEKDAEKLLMEMPEVKVAGISYEVEPIVSGRFFALQSRTEKWRPCVTKDTIILCNPSPKRISEIKEGDLVYSLGNNFKLEKRRVIRKIYSGIKKVYLLKANGHEIKATEDHPFLCLKGKKVTLIRDKKGRIHGKKSEKIFEWVALKDLKKGDLIAIYKEIPEEGSNTKFSLDFCRLVGLFLGDGSLLKKGNYLAGIQWAIPKQDKVRKKYEEIIKREFGKCSSKRYLRVYSHKAAELFKKLDLDHYGKDKYIPSWVFGLPKQHKLAIIEGMIDSDGHIQKAEKGKRKLTYSYYSVSKRLVEDLKTLLQSMGFNVSNIMEEKIKPERKIGAHIIKSNSKSYGITWVNGRKKPTSFRYPGGIKFSNFPITVTRIKDIIPLGMEEVYDLEIEGTHNFIANGLIVHNCPGGVSIGHPLVTGGTLGAVLYDNTGRKVILSNNHILAASNQGKIGDKILQPAKYDGGTDADAIATLYRFVELKQEGNLVDAALALPLADNLVSEDILGIGRPTGFGTAVEGMHVKKSGRTTGVTEGTVFDTKATIKVYGYPWGYSTFEDQIIITPAMMEAGDSGCVILDDSNRIVGLGFAGSDKFAVANKIQYVVSMLGLSEKGVAPTAPSLGAVGLLLLFALFGYLTLGR